MRNALHRRFGTCVVGVLLLPAVSACMPGRYTHDEPYAEIVYPEAQAPLAGAIVAPGQGLLLFEDAKARAVGDMLTINLVENTRAQKSASTTTSKTSELGVGAAVAFGTAVPETESSISAERSFDGSGDTELSNQLSGTLTVFVVKRLPNGNLVVRGDKQLRLNQGSEEVRLEGVVRPIDIAANNTVDSTRVGNARVVYAGRGALADANAQGWLARFFNSPWIPF